MNKTRLLKSFFLVTLLLASFIGGSSAFYSGIENSTGNVLGTGTINLKIAKESYYNGVFNAVTSWELSDLDYDKGSLNSNFLFYNFNSVKPGDLGTDLISLHVTDNNYWACIDISLTNNDDFSSTDSELQLDFADDPSDLFDGELAQEMNMVWWADDGDGVLEEDENILAQNTFFNLTNSSLVLADSSVNYWSNDSEPLLGSADTNENVYYLAVAWCFGTLTTDPKEQLDNNRLLGLGLSCSGINTTDITQTDTLMVDFNFRAIQSRNNPIYTCNAEKAVFY